MATGCVTAIVNGKDGEGYQAWQSNYFEGDMTVKKEGFGRYIYDHLPQINKHWRGCIKELVEFLKWEFFGYVPGIVDVRCYDYPREPNPKKYVITAIPDEYLDMRTWDWMNNYTFLRNWSDKTITITITDDRSVKVAPNSGVILLYNYDDHYCDIYSPEEGADEENWVCA